MHTVWLRYGVACSAQFGHINHFCHRSPVLSIHINHFCQFISTTVVNLATFVNFCQLRGQFCQQYQPDDLLWILHLYYSFCKKRTKRSHKICTWHPQTDLVSIDLIWSTMPMTGIPEGCVNVQKRILWSNPR